MSIFDDEEGIGRGERCYYVEEKWDEETEVRGWDEEVDWGDEEEEEKIKKYEEKIKKEEEKIKKEGEGKEENKRKEVVEKRKDEKKIKKEVNIRKGKEIVEVFVVDLQWEEVELAEEMKEICVWRGRIEGKIKGKI